MIHSRWQKLPLMSNAVRTTVKLVYSWHVNVMPTKLYSHVENCVLSLQALPGVIGAVFVLHKYSVHPHDELEAEWLAVSRQLTLPNPFPDIKDAIYGADNWGRSVAVFDLLLQICTMDSAMHWLRIP